MTTSTLNRDAQLSTLANAAYLDNPPTTIGSWTRIGDPQPTASGFFGVAYYNSETKQVVVSFRGTDGAKDLLADTTFKTGGWNQQFTDAAAYTASVKAEIASKPREYPGGATMLTTGHSLGGGISQIIAEMFGLNGSSYEAPGASSVTANAQYAAVKAQYASDSRGTIGSSFTNYRAEGSFISSVGTMLGNTQNMVNLTDAGAVSFVSALLAITGIATGGLGGLVTSALGVTGVNVDTRHSMDGMERTLYIAAGLEKAIGNGSVKMATVGLSQATGQAWTGVGAEPQVTVFKDANNQVTAYIQKDGAGWKLSTPDQQTTITLTPSAIKGEAPTCIVKEPGKNAYSCTLNEKDGDVTRSIDTNRDGVIDQTTTTNHLADNVIQTQVDTNGDGKVDTSNLNLGTVNYNLLDLNQRADAEYRLNALRNNNEQGLNLSDWNNFTSDSTRQLLGGGTGLTPGGGSYGLQPPANWLDPIGAFYDSQTAGFDNAASIANKTSRAMNANGQELTKAQLAALDTIGDGQISTAEAAGIRLWADLNENGTLDANELLSVGSAIKADDYGFYTRGNGTPAGAKLIAPTVVTVGSAGNHPQAPSSSEPSYSVTAVASAPFAPIAASLPLEPNNAGVPASNYRTLRDTDNRYVINSVQWIDFSPSQVKINNGNRSYLIGTDGNDSFDSSYFASYAQWFNSGLLTNFLGGGGNDEMGGSTRNDNLWGGTGNDTVYGYAGDDKIYGEEGDDALLGQDGNDTLDAGIGNDALIGGSGNDVARGGDGSDELQGQDGDDKLLGQAGNDNVFGQVGNDSLWGGEGDDLLMGFTANNEAQQSLYAGQTDNDVLMGEGGIDTLNGGVGQDLLDGGVGNDLLDGGAGDDTLQGQAGLDKLYGGDGADRLDGGADNDMLQGQSGDDSLWGGDGLDELQGNDGADQLMGQAGNDKLFGQVGNDSLWGGEGDDLLMGFTGNNEAQQSLYPGQTDNDVLMGEGGNDTLIGGVGQDLLDGGVGNDVLDGEAGDDTLQGQAGADELYGGDGADRLDGGADNDLLQGESGNDSLWGGDGADELQGNEGNDQLMGQTGNDKLFGQAGNDTLWGGEGDDLLVGFTTSNEAQQSLYAGQTDNDVLMGEAGNDNIFAGLGDDLADGGVGNDLVDGGDGNDTLLGGLGNDQLQGQAGQDVIDGGDGNDTLLAGSGNDKVWGGTGIDELQGNEGNDYLMGEADNDKLFGQVGNDTLSGGDGDDILVGFTASNDDKKSLSAGETDDDVLSGGAGNDNLYGGFGQDALDGGSGNDLLLGEDGNDSLWGADGNDELQGNAANDQIDGGAGDDKLFGQVGNDTMWGGEGNDLLMGFTAINEDKQSLNTGETDDDWIDAGAGSDVVIAGLGQDTVFGGLGRDELQGGAGHDMLYGEDGNDNLFGQVGNDSLYGGGGDDYIQGFTGSNEAKQTLDAGESDDDFLYGGAGADILVGGVGNDYLDGGAGADQMIGGQGDDVYIVNTVNDTIYEKAGEGYDTVITNSNYLLNANIEELRLLEGFNIHGTGNALNNKIIGNSSDNILDGITGADTMIGGAGNDTYYVDNAGDVVTELSGEGTDVVQSSNSYTLGANVENLVLLDFSKPEKGLVDGKSVLVYGYPKRNELDYMQGDEVDNYEGTCALTSIANLLTQTGRPTSESQVVNLAINNNWAVNDPNLPSYLLGGSNVNDQRAILNSFNIRNDVIAGYNESGLANLLRSGRGVIVAVNAGTLWGDDSYKDSGAVNHAVTLTGAVCNEGDGSLAGFYLTDSGRGKVSDMTRFVDIATFRQIANVPGAYSIFTIEPVKYWQEDINGTGNELSNSIAGNRGDNVLAGLAGDDVISAQAGQDTLIGGAGNDTLDGDAGDDVYQFSRGDGTDVIIDSEGVDTLVLGAGIVAADVKLSLSNGRLTLANGNDSVSMQAGAGKLLEQVQFTDGTVWYARADGTGYNASMTGQLNVTGQAQQGQTLTLSNTLTDPDGLGAFTYQWERSVNGVDWVELSGASSSSLVLGQDLVGHRVRARASFIDGRGNAEAVTSYATGSVANVNDAPSGTVSVSGIAAQGQTLTASHTLADADGLGAISWQWFADDQAISGATDASLVLGQELVDKAIIVLASYTDGFGTQENVRSLATDKVQPPTVAGTSGDDTLTGSPGADRMAGLAGNDTLYGVAGDDTLIGGTGNDLLVGRWGNDTYVFNTGDGADTISDQDWTAGNIDTLKLGAGLLAKDTWVVRNQGNLTLSWGADSVHIPGFFSGSAYQVEAFKFADNTTWGIADIAQRISGTAGADYISSVSGYANRINGLAGNDTLTGGSLADTLDGGSGNDSLSGGEGNDWLTGGTGNDSLFGGIGNDIYVFNQGDGADTISDYDTTVGIVDTLRLGLGLLPSATVTGRVGNNLTLTWGTDSVTVQNYFSSSTENRIEKIEFADGTQWGAADSMAKLPVQNGTAASNYFNGWVEFANHMYGFAGNDTMTGGNKDDVLDGGDDNDSLLGGAGNDTLYGVAGDDTLIGGTGNDLLVGRWGNDTYIFNQGDGADTISDQDWTAGNKDTLQLGVGLLAKDTLVVRNQGNLTLSWGADSVYIPGFFSGSAYQVEAFKFADGTTWGINEVMSRLIFNGTTSADNLSGWSEFANTINGLAGNDTLNGGSKNDVLDGGDGNDNLTGGAGNDTLTSGNGKDTLTGGDGADKFVFSNSPIIGNSDVLTDFMASQGDQMLFDTSFFAQLSGKSDLTNHIRKYSAKSVGSDDYIIYDNTTGNLYYDPTGISNANAVLIANLQNKPLTMAANQFAVL